MVEPDDQIRHARIDAARAAGLPPIAAVKTAIEWPADVDVVVARSESGEKPWTRRT